MSEPRRDTGTFEGTSEDQSGPGTLRGTFLTDDGRWRTFRDRIVAALAVVAIFAMSAVAYFTIQTNRTLQEVNQGQVAIVQAQNNAQLCAQHDIVLAVRSIGDKLGLPVDDIAVPDVSRLNCP